jgi:hypothetical protein
MSRAEIVVVTYGFFTPCGTAVPAALHCGVFVSCEDLLSLIMPFAAFEVFIKGEARFDTRKSLCFTVSILNLS